jgi:Bacterial regulatory protein, Fis family
MTAAPEAGARPAPRRPDWRRAAALLACDYHLGETARRVGCSRSQLSRKLHRDPVFQGWIEEFKSSGPGSEVRLALLREAVQEKIEAEVLDGNLRVVLWMADRLKLVSASSQRTSGEELRELLSGLSSTELREFESLRDAPLAGPSGAPDHQGALSAGPRESPDPGLPDSRA